MYLIKLIKLIKSTQKRRRGKKQVTTKVKVKRKSFIGHLHPEFNFRLTLTVVEDHSGLS